MSRTFNRNGANKNGFKKFERRRGRLFVRPNSENDDFENPKAKRSYQDKELKGHGKMEQLEETNDGIYQ